MTWIYIASLLFGGVFLVPMMLGGLDLDTEFDFDAYGDADIELDFDFDSGDLDIDGVGNSLGDFVGSLLSFRTIVFFAAFFGISGLVFDNLLDRSSALALTLAVTLGLVAALTNASLMRLIKKNVNDSSVTEREMQGTAGTVVLPIGEDRKGRIRMLVGGQTTYMVALPFRSHADPFEVGDEIVVIEIEDGTALVAPLPGLGSGERN